MKNCDYSLDINILKQYALDMLIIYKGGHLKKLVEMPDDLFKDLENQAIENSRSVNKEIVNIIKNGVRPKPKGKLLHKQKGEV